MSRFANLIIGILHIVMGSFLLLSLMSFSASDPSFNHATDVKEIHNLCGTAGAYIASPLITIFGFSLVSSMLFFIISGIFMLRKKLSLIEYIVRFSASLLSIPLFAMTLYFINTYISKKANFGGILGKFLASEYQIQLIFKILIGLVALICFFASCYISISMILQFLKIIGRFFEMLCKYCYIYFKKLFLRGDKKAMHNIELDDITPSEMPIATNKVDTRVFEQKKLKLDQGEFELPYSALLKESKDVGRRSNINDAALTQNAKILKKVLEDFGIIGEIIKINPGPVVTLYEFEPAAGVKSSRVIGLSDDIARSMSAVSARIAIIPGKIALGIELPNAHREMVVLRELLESKAYKNNEVRLPLVLGKNIGGDPVIADLAKMPHLLVAGTTGSGKSVAINTMILSLLYHHAPTECKFIMIDPKMLELSVYDGIPHLLAPVVTDPKKAVAALKWVVKEMENRYRLMSTIGVRNLDGYNKVIADAIKSNQKIEKKIQIGFDSQTGSPKYESIIIEKKSLPFIVVIVDEMADLMIVAGKEIEGSIQRLAQMARAAGIHIIMATQRPSVDVITGIIKANFPTRISFQVTSKIDSRTILGEQGAEQLLGMGDMLFMRGGGRIERVHGPFVSDAEVEKVTHFLKSQMQPEYIHDITTDTESESGIVDGSEEGDDDLYRQAVEIVLRDRKVSTSYIQRCLRIGYNRAAIIVEKMEKLGIVSPPNHTGKREILRDS